MSYVGNVASGGELNLVASTLYGECASLASTAAKVVTIANYDALLIGTTIHVKFLYTNTAANPTLNVNDTGAKPIYVDGVSYPGVTPFASWNPNSVVSLTYDGVAWRMNDTGMPASNANQSILNTVYPVGAIYLTVNATNPGLLFGGTWERITNKFLLAAGDGHDAGTTGGAETVTLDATQIPGHTHTVPAHAHGLNGHTHTVGPHAHGLNNHTHSVPAHSHGLNAHTHSVGAHSHGLNSHVHTVGAHSHGLNNHTHGIPQLSGSTGQGGSHGHRSWFAPQWSGYTPKEWGFHYEKPGSLSADENPASSGLEYGGNHTHSVTTNSSTTGQASGSTANSGAFNSGGASGNTANSTSFDSGVPSVANTANSASLTSGTPSTANTANSIEFNTGACNTNTANSSELTSGSAGGGQAHNNMPPYLSVYVWKRVA